MTSPVLAFASAVLAGTLWSVLEWGDLLVTSSIQFALPYQWPLFLVTHVSIGIAACLVGVVLFQLGTSLVAPVCKRLGLRSPTLAVSLVLFGFHALVWVAAALTGFFQGHAAAIAVGLVCIAGGVFLVRGPLPWRSTAPRSYHDWLRAVGCFSLVAAVHLFNRLWNAKFHFPIHVALSVCALSAALYGSAHFWRAVARPETWWSPSRRTTLVASVVVVVAVLATPRVLFEVSNDVRHVLFTRAFDAKTVIYASRKLRGIGIVDARPAMPAAPATTLVAGSKRVERVILISVDTLRADHLPSYGYGRDTAPRIAQLAREGTTFDWAWSVGAHTEHGLRALFAQQNPRPGLEQRLATAGISRTAIVFRAFDRYTRGFDRARMVEGSDDAALADAAVREIEGGQLSPFTWIHFFAPHRPYDRHAERSFGEAPVDLYDAEIAHTDRAIGRVLDALDRTGLADSTAVIVTADHGEEFQEHGGEAHGWDVFNELIRIPLVMRVPGGVPHRVQAHVTQRDVPATITDLFGIGQYPGAKDRSLLPLVLGAARSDDRVVMSGPLSSFDAGAVMSGRWKLHFCLFNDSRALYDLTADPRERLNLFEARPQIAARLDSLLGQLLADPYNLGPPVTASDDELAWEQVAQTR